MDDYDADAAFARRLIQFDADDRRKGRILDFGFWIGG